MPQEEKNQYQIDTPYEKLSYEKLKEKYQEIKSIHELFEMKK